ncbi:hypothetical protein AAFN47_23520 [Hoeflea sp. CAU 1731]
MDTPIDTQATALRTAIDSLMRRFKIAEQEVVGEIPLKQTFDLLSERTEVVCEAKGHYGQK